MRSWIVAVGLALTMLGSAEASEKEKTKVRKLTFEEKMVLYMLDPRRKCTVMDQEFDVQQALAYLEGKISVKQAMQADCKKLPTLE